MKRFLAIVLCGIMALSIASCSTADTGSSSGRISSGAGSKPEAGLSGTDVTAKETRPETADTNGQAAGSEDFDPDFVFETTDRDGNVWNEQSLSSNKLTMINFWEPWCGPCVREIPDLERLYENYKDKGFVILGVYGEPGMENEVSDILDNGKVTYPVLHYTDEFDRFQTGYVPTTVFIDSKGHIITMRDGTDSVIGSNTYAEWEAIINNYL